MTWERPLSFPFLSHHLSHTIHARFMDHTVHNMLEHHLLFADECMADNFGDDDDYPYNFTYEVDDIRMMQRKQRHTSNT